MAAAVIRKWLARFSARGGDAALQKAQDLILEGDAAFQRDDFVQAESNYRQAIICMPGLAHSHVGLGAVLRVMGRFDEAIAVLHEALKIDDAHAGAHELLAACHLATADMIQAESHLRRAVKLKPLTESNYLDLGAVLVGQRRYHEALQAVQQGAANNPGFADLQLFLANLQYETGHFELAAASYRDALKLKPDQLLALHNFGLALIKTNEFEQAASAFRRAIELNPEWADAHNNLGYVYHRLGRLGDAEASFERALLIDPGLALAHANAGELAMTRADAGKAIDHYRRATEINPDMAQAHLHLSNALAARGQRDDAIRHLEHCLEIVPDSVEAQLQLARLYAEAENFQSSLAWYREIVAVLPNHIDALVGMAEALLWFAEYGDAASKADRLKEAVTACRNVLSREPDHLRARLMLGALLGQSGKLDEADVQFEAVLLLDPGNANARHNLGVSTESRARLAPASEKLALLEKALEHYAVTGTADPHHIDALMGMASIHVEKLYNAEAATLYERILQIDPDYVPARMSYAMLKLKTGDFTIGWRDFESRWRMGNKWKAIQLQSDKPQWSKDVSLAGKTIILYHEQGLGDSLQFIRYASLVAERGARVVVRSPAALRALFASCAGVHAVFDGDEIPEHDFLCPLMSLPLVFGTTLDTIPAAIPYLRPAPERVLHWRRKFDGENRLRVGVVWAGDPRLQDDNMRSLHFDRLRPLLEVPGVAFYSMQMGSEAKAQMADVPQIANFTDALFDFQETAALAENLDLAICVDTSSAHLVGAIGKPVWLLNRFNTCWRWMLDRSDSPWYPTMRIFRQPRLGDWDSVIAKVKLALEEEAVRKRRG